MITNLALSLSWIHQVWLPIRSDRLHDSIGPLVMVETLQSPSFGVWFWLPKSGFVTEASR